MEIKNDRFSCSSFVNLNIRKLKSETTRVICFAQTEDVNRASDACVVINVNEKGGLTSTKIVEVMVEATGSSLYTFAPLAIYGNANDVLTST